MISDVLYEAIEDIEEYQKLCPDAYDSITEEIENVKSVMRKLQHKLDVGPTGVDECQTN